MKKEFYKRYDKFKKNNLPTPFWDEERQTLEYVCLGNKNTIYDFENAKNKIDVYYNIVDALSNVAQTGFYYPFTAKHFVFAKENEPSKDKAVVGHTHAHNFEDVVSHLYDAPETFRITKDEEEFYSKQELNYLKKVQKYLLFIGVKDLETPNVSNDRFKNGLHAKYADASIWTWDSNVVEEVLNNKLNYIVINWYEEYEFKSNRALIRDSNYDFKLFIETTHSEIKVYKDIKEKFFAKNIKDDDKVIIEYFKILNIFDNVLNNNE